MVFYLNVVKLLYFRVLESESDLLAKYVCAYKEFDPGLQCLSMYLFTVTVTKKRGKMLRAALVSYSESVQYGLLSYFICQ